METPSRALSRLVASLETLIDQEALEVASGDFAGFQRTQQRVGPLVAKLAQIGSGPVDETMRVRLAALAARRGQIRVIIASRVTHLRAELTRVGNGLRRLSSVSTFYSGAANRSTRRRLSAIG
jgi:hypothetical protein